jgi:hypothetical protein
VIDPSTRTWRTGEAFEEAHDETSIGAFVSTMMSSTMIFKGAQGQFYDGLLQQSMKLEAFADIIDGWLEACGS